MDPDEPLGSGTLGARKREVRAAMRARRAAIPAAERAAMSDRVGSSVMGLPETASAQSVLVFRSFGSEVDTHGLIDELCGTGALVLLPFLEAGELGAARYAPGDPLIASGYGAMEPRVRDLVDPSGVGLVLVPGLAFDRDGNRIGYGGGFYDRYLRRLGVDAARIGLAFHQQLLDRVPHGGGDEPVDAIVTDLEVIRTAAGRA